MSIFKGLIEKKKKGLEVETLLTTELQKHIKDMHKIIPSYFNINGDFKICTKSTLQGYNTLDGTLLQDGSLYSRNTLSAYRTGENEISLYFERFERQSIFLSYWYSSQKTSLGSIQTDAQESEIINNFQTILKKFVNLFI